MTQDMNHTFRKALRAVFVATMMSLTGSHALAQVTVRGSVFGGGNEADVQTNTEVNISAGTVEGNVYGGGNLGDVGTIDKTDQTTYNYIWTTNTDNDTNNDTGICTVSITGGTVGAENKSTENHASGHVFGAGKGSGTDTYYCEKGMVYKTNVSITKGTVYGSVYGGGEVGRVENDAVVEIGSATEADAPEVKGSVFGAGAGLETHGYSALVRNNTNVTVQGYAKVRNNVYGGGEIAAVGRYWVKLDPPMEGAPTPPDGTILGMPYQQRSGGICTVIVKDHAEIGPKDALATETAGHVYGGGKGVTPHYSAGTSKKMTPSGALVGFSDDTETGKTAEQLYYEFLETLALITNSSVTIGGSATGTDTKVKGSVYGGSENGFVQHNTSVSIQSGSTVGTSNSYGNIYGGGKGYEGFAAAGRVSGTTAIEVSGGTAYGSVYGGGELGFVKGAVNVNVTGGTITKDVYGGGAQANTNTENWNGTTLVSPYHEEIGLTAGTSVVTGLYTRTGSAEPYTYTEITTADTKAAQGTTYYRLTDTKVSLMGGTISGDAYGGGLGRKEATGATAIEAMVYGDVLVELNGTTVKSTDSQTNEDVFTPTPITGKGCIVNRVFGCNNVNGTPKGEVTVHVYATQSSIDGKGTVSDKADKNTNTYDVQAVYGGGNQAEYYPVRADDTNAVVHTNVIIDGCTQTSIQNVYGGGNAASTPSTSVTINGAYEIGEVFGGGNGASTLTFTNPGANVGFHDYSAVESTYPTKAQRQQEAFINTYVYGSGKASVNIFGGTVHRVFGGSNTKGNVRITAITMLEDKNGCDFCMDEAYGGGKSAPMDAEAKLLMACIPGLRAAYGGAEAADVLGDVTLNITNGTFDRVFGGNNLSGTISGSITVNIEETGCKPIIIGELYGGGNQAAYSVFGYKKSGTTNVIRTSKDDDVAFYAPTTPYSSNQLFADPQVNVKSFTSIGKIFGGGLGTTATMVGNPSVNISVANGNFYNDDNAVVAEGYETPGNYPVPSHAKGEIGAINNVYGGGNAADVVGNTNVNIGTDEYVFVTKEYAVGATLSENCYIHTGAGTATSPYTYTSASGTAAENMTYYERIAVVGADIRGNVYGGGYGANTTVTGNVEVNIGGEKTVGEGSSATTTFIGGNIIIGESVYGGSALGAVNASTTKNDAGVITAYNATDGATTKVTLKKGRITGAVYGGGMGEEPSTTNASGTNAKVYGDATVTLYGDVIAGGIYGGCNLNGTMFGDAQLDLLGGTVGTAFDETSVPEIPNIVFGGGLGALTTVVGDVTVNVNKSDKTPRGVAIYSNVYGGSKKGSVGKADVNLLGGVIWGDVFGGGYSTAEGKIAATDVTVTLNGTAFGITYEKDDTDKDVPKTGRVFGCNNLQGSPIGDVTVNVLKTTDLDADHAKTASDKLTSTTPSDHYYNVQAVYGGGNLAAYAPTASGAKSQVNIRGCTDTSIEYVYGGGNAAAVPETNVLVMGAYEIGTVFGGGNGKDKYLVGNTWTVNPGANVSGNATTLLKGGFIHEAYGGSNSKGIISGSVSIDKSSGGECDLAVVELYGAGKDADIEGDLIMVMGCSESRTETVYGCAMNANVKGNVELTITSGEYGKVFGGNNQSGAIFGHIIVNIEESGCRPIEIDELYGCGNDAPYSVYGYYHAQKYVDGDKLYLDKGKTIPLYKDGDNLFKDERKTIPLYINDDNKLYLDQEKTRALYMPRQSGNDPNTIVTFADINPHTVPDATTHQYDDPEVNIISCTRIGKVFGGGLGSSAIVYGNPKVNISQIFGIKEDPDHADTYIVATELGRIGIDKNGSTENCGVFGGGNQAKVVGNTMVNIGTETTVQLHQSYDKTTEQYSMSGNQTILGANILSNVYGGGNLADVTGNTFVNICAEKLGENYVAVTEGDKKVTIAGNVYGGGKGIADTFTCEKAMVGINDAGLTDTSDGGTTVVIGNGTVNGTVYGGGEIGRVEKNTKVTIGIGPGEATVTSTSSAPEIKGNVFGGGKGEEEHGYAALVRGNPTVTIEGNAKVGHSVYGGGEIASVARYKVAETKEEAEANGVSIDMPYVLADPDNPSGVCTVIVQGYAEIGPDGMQMTKTDGPDDTGYVFGAGKGILPGGDYEYVSGRTRRMVLYDKDVHTSENTHWTYVDPDHSETNKNVWEYFADLDEYIQFIQTLALSSYTDVTISGNAFIKGSVYGGSENGIVQFDTEVTIEEDCQIGNGDGVNARYTSWPTATQGITTSMKECASWPYQAPYAPYDQYAIYKDGDKYYYDVSHNLYAESGAKDATDGHTFYGNVFGGGSGSVPYFDNKLGRSMYLHSAGLVKRDTKVYINGGHILTNVYGGCEATNVLGTATVTMTDGTIGVPRTDDDIKKHPLTGYLFGGGKGDQRIFFNKDTNVKDAVVTVEGGRIYGSVYGGGEDGHVLRHVTVTIGKETDHSGPTIGTQGTSYYDGHVFGGGRGFGGDALTAGNVGGSVELNIEGGSILGSVYGGGRLASVGYGLYLVDEEVKIGGNTVKPYGVLRPDDQYDNPANPPSTTETAAEYFGNKGRGHINITINGGTIGNDVEYVYNPTEVQKAGVLKNTQFDAETNRLLHTRGGNVFAGSMGSLYKQDGVTVNALWPKLAHAKQTTVTINNGEIKSSVYGGGELGKVDGSSLATSQSATNVIITGGTIGTEIKNGETVEYTYGSVFGGGYGSTVEEVTDENGVTTNPRLDAGIITGNTSIDMSGDNSRVWASVYGGGEVASVNGNTDVIINGGKVGKDKVGDKQFGGATMGNVYGGGSGYKSIVRAGHIWGNAKVTIGGGTIYHNVYGGGAYGTVGDFNYTYSTNLPGFIGKSKVNGIDDESPLNTANTGTADVIITGGIIGVDGIENGMVFGSSRGDVGEERDDWLAWVYDTHVIIGTSATGTEGEEGYVAEAGPDIKGSVYGSGENGHVFHDAEVKIHGGTIGIHDGSAADAKRGNVYGGGCGEDKYDSDNNGSSDMYNPLAGIVYGNTKVTMDGGTVLHNIYGAGALGSVGKTDANYAVTSGGKTTIDIIGGTVGYDGDDNGNVYGAARGDVNSTQTGISQVQETEVNIKPNTIEGEPDVKGSVFGGGQAGIVRGSVKVEMTGGNVGHDVYGGGALADTQTSNWDATKDNGEGKPKGGWAAGKTSASSTTKVNLYGGLIKGDAYGGGLGRLEVKSGETVTTEGIEAKVYGDVIVNQGKENDESKITAYTITYLPTNVLKKDDKGNDIAGQYVEVVNSGRIFGCNNLNGSPQGNVTVTVNGTTTGNIERTEITHDETTKEVTNVPTPHTYEVAAVYGGGNLANYTPAGGAVKVIINSCNVSVEEVYGGGNAAEVPATDVEVKGAWEIEHVFGGGNGEDKYTLDGGTTWIENPGANINGDTKTILMGGLIHEAYGGSNEKGTITGNITIDTTTGGLSDCPLKVEKIVGAGKNADVNGDLIVVMGCKPSQKVPVLYAGADNANVNGNVELTITSGNYGKVFGGNNQGGAIKGHIIVNIEETGTCTTPITIDELYLGGYNAAYSRYGYYLAKDGNGAQIYRDTEQTKPLLKPRTSANDLRKPVKLDDTEYANLSDFTAYDQPVLNVVSCTYIGQVYGGGYGESAVMYADPTVNINMIPGTFADNSNVGVTAVMTAKELNASDNPNKLGIIGNVYGGGNAAAVIGNPTVSIGMEKTVRCHMSFDKKEIDDTHDGYTYSDAQDVLGAYITGNVFGGGNLAEVSGNTYVNICGTQIPVPTSESENGYKDTAVSHSETDGFAVSIGNSVYGGGNAADVLGNTFVTMADGYVFNGIFGGGLAGSVGTYTRDKTVTVFEHDPEHEGTCIGKPTECTAGGTCYVVVSGGQIGPIEVATQGMNRIDANGGPVPQGWVWGGGCGIVEDPANYPDTHFKAYVNNTDVTIKDNAFILESIIGGGEFGRVLGNTLVKIKGGQIGVGEGMVANGKPVRYTENQWTAAETAVRSGDASAIAAAALTPCSHFPYGKVVDGKTVYNTYDLYADSYQAAKGSYLYPGGVTDGASDGKTWIGCVFAGGSGYMPVVKAKDANGNVTDYDWISSAGWVEGNSEVRISGGHILTNVYGGNEVTSVGTEGVANTGKCTVKMTGGTIGVPRTRAQIEALPMTGYLFGGGKGDPRAHFDDYTNTGSVEIEVSGGTIFGSVYGGSEDGHVLGNVTVKVKDTTTTTGEGSEAVTTTTASPFIGTLGTSQDGNVFGGGRGFSGENMNAGAVRGNIGVTIEGGKMLGNVYGGGELGSVGTFTVSSDMRTFTWGTPYNKTGVCNVTINGGTIGTGVAVSDDGTYANGNVFGAGKGLEDTYWCEKAIAYKTNVTITDGTIKGTVYGGGQVGRVENDATVTIGTENEEGTDSKPNITGNVFGAGAGLKTHGYSALVRGDAYVTVQGIAQVGKSVYGGGEIASVGKFTLVDGLPKHPDSGGTCTVNIKGHAKIGAGGTGHNVFGACKGVTPAFVTTGDNRSKSMQLLTNAPEDATLWSHYNNDVNSPFIWRYYPDEAAYLDFLETLALTSHPIVTIAEDATVNGSVFGGGERGVTLGSVEVNMNGGTVTEDVYGGGSLANSNKGNWDDDTNEGSWATGKVDAEGKTTYKTTVNLLGGTITNVYGGGLGQKEVKTGETVTTPGIEAIVYGDVKVNLNGLETDDYKSDIHSSLVTNVATSGTYYRVPDTRKGCVVTGNIFGCNNINGTPKGHAKVHVFKTVDSANSTKNSSTPVDQRTTYDVAAVFGGGNAADYVPADLKQSSEVIIEGCDLTSIKDVYGGGYGAATPGTNVLIKGSYIIDNVFGGGYGAGDNNPGANVGIRTTGAPYGLHLDDKTKIAVVEMMSGAVRNIYGGSNTRGDIRNGSSVTTVDKTNEPGCCTELYVEEIYGGGQEAPMEGGAEIVLGCMPEDWIGEIYAGARKADVGNDVSLTITSGKFGSVFGGNRDSGTIDGSVEVNIEECPTCGKPGIVIGELYGGGNLAPYTVPQSYVDGWKQQYGEDADYPSPRVNVHSFTSIGTIYGGGFGTNAVVTGNPTVNINVGMVIGGGLAYDPSNDSGKPSDVTLYPHEKNKIGVIGNVFGGGNAAKVEGNTTVNIGTSEYEQLSGVIAGETDVTGYYTRSGSAGNYVYTLVEPVSPATSVIAEEGTLYYIKVVGADIRGNVYGGGNEAEVTGKTNVVIGKEAE